MSDHVKKEAQDIILDINSIILGLQECVRELQKSKGISEKEASQALELAISKYKNLRSHLYNL